MLLMIRDLSQSWPGLSGTKLSICWTTLGGCDCIAVNKQQLAMRNSLMQHMERDVIVYHLQ